MTVTVIERLAHVAPLGVRLLDVATGEIISDGLRVRVVPLLGGRPVDAFRTPSGTFAVRGVPGLRDWETRDVGDDGLAIADGSPPVAVRVEVTDELGRFHGFSAQTELPVPGGLFTPAFASPSDGAYIPLYSLPGRRLAAGTAAVRATLVEEFDQTTPAAYARLEVTPPAGPTAVGIADERGEVLVCLPYPAPAGALGSPPASQRRPLSRASWTVGLAVFAPAAALSPPATPALPSLETFSDQAPASLVSATSPPTVRTAGTLEYGRELVLRSSPTDAVHYVRR
jgi:hypothetical protein